MSSADGGRLARLARLVLRRRGAVIAARLAAVVAIAVLAPRIAGDHEADYATPGSDSAAAADLVAERFPGSSGEAVDVVWTAPEGEGDPAARATGGWASPARSSTGPPGTPRSTPPSA